MLTDQQKATIADMFGRLPVKSVFESGVVDDSSHDTQAVWNEVTEYIASLRAALELGRQIQKAVNGRHVYPQGASNRRTYVDGNCAIAADVLDVLGGATASTPSETDVEKIVAAIVAHHYANPSHGVDCSCMDRYIRAVRQMTLVLPKSYAAQARVDYVIRSALNRDY